MSCLNLSDLAERPGALELAQVASSEHEAAVPAPVMDRLVREGGPLPDDPGEARRAAAAIARISDALASAGGIIDGYLSRRYRLPLSREIPIVREWARAIARYLLHKDRRALEKEDPIVRDYYDAMNLLRLTAEKKFSLGADDPEQGASFGTDVRFSGDPNVFSREELSHFR
jgi:phage gp36-like protein